MGETVQRVWGHYTFMSKDSNVVVKEMVILPGKEMSYQRHFKRSEAWFVSKGKCMVRYSVREPWCTIRAPLSQFDKHDVPCGTWHQLINPHDEPCHIIEIQYGECPDEDDIERMEI